MVQIVGHQCLLIATFTYLLSKLGSYFPTERENSGPIFLKSPLQRDGSPVPGKLILKLYYWQQAKEIFAFEKHQGAHSLN